MLIKNKIILLVIIFFICAHFSFAQTKNINSAAVQNGRAVNSVKGARETPKDNSLHQHEVEEPPGKHEHSDEDKGEHISSEHEKLELFHAEYYGMPWRSPQTQRDLWIIMGFLLFVNLGLLLIIRNKLKRKYGHGKR